MILDSLNLYPILIVVIAVYYYFKINNKDISKKSYDSRNKNFNHLSKRREVSAPKNKDISTIEIITQPAPLNTNNRYSHTPNTPKVKANHTPKRTSQIRSYLDIAYAELLSLGCKETFDKTNNCYRIRLSKDLKGAWFHPMKAGKTTIKERLYFYNFSSPILREVLKEMENQYPSIVTIGGRTNITRTHTYKSQHGYVITNKSMNFLYKHVNSI